MKIGIVGLGARVGYLARLAVQQVPEARLVGYVDPTPYGLSTLSEAGIDAGPAYGAVAELLRAEKLDLLMVGSPNHLHLEHIRAGLEAGVRVFTEKPVVTTEAETYELLELLRQSGGADRVIIGLVLRYAPLYRDLVASYRTGTLGKITSIEASEHIAPYHGAFFMRDWRRRTGYSGGFILEKCCHDIDLYQGLVGNRPVRVASFGGRKTFVPENMPSKAGINDLDVYFRKPGGWESDNRVWDGDGDIIDYQTALVEYSGGENLCFHTNLNVPDEYRHFTVVGTHGMAEGDFVRNFYRVHDARTGEKLSDKRYETNTGSVHYGADEQMVADIFAHLTDGVALPGIDRRRAGGRDDGDQDRRGAGRPAGDRPDRDLAAVRQLRAELDELPVGRALRAVTAPICSPGILGGQSQDQVDKAKAAGVPVITIDGAKNASSVLNVTSDNFVLGETMTKFLFDQIGNKGNIVRFFYSAHPGVHQRELALDAALKANAEVKQVADHYVAVPGQVDDSRSAMDAMLLANPGDGAINAVWAGWDEPGIGAQLAIEAAGRKGIIVAGIDGNPQAIELIKGCTAYVGTVRQGFGEMANIAADQLNTILAGGPAKADELFAPVELITRESLGVTCP